MKTSYISEENQNGSVIIEPCEKFKRKKINNLPVIENLQFIECVGEGTFSHVYKGIYHQKDQVAIKIIERGSDYLIKNEIDILTKLKGVSHVVQLYDVIYCDQFDDSEDCDKSISSDQKEQNDLSVKSVMNNQTSHLRPSSFSKLTLLIFEYLDGIDSFSYIQSFSLDQIRILLRLILEALSAAHELGIVHRDVKLSNIIILPDFSDVKLIDWGCATFVNENMSPKSGSREYRPPEMLLGYQKYGCGCDIWAVGIIILFILTGGIIPWKARTSKSTLIKMSEYVGGECLNEYAKKLNLKIDSETFDEFYEQPQRSIESDFDETIIEELQSKDLVKLMRKCLIIDYDLRPTAKELLENSFFRY